ncbi:MAG: hypothetical protein EZS28_022367 [Streblomastix strix]|uniref:Uncharacterized protein n=1 Tax=Streblomastix strix TaxID=222440 RepID=A0A5J4VHW1_9EUKA|nr:MAG: hypothetical protein EZS28_022367 [Streblomastix strix]
MNYRTSLQILWQPKRLTPSPNFFIQLTGALDLYDELSESAANPIVINASSVKFIDIEAWYNKTQYDSQSSLADAPFQCPFIGNFQQYTQMLIVSVSNQLQGITLQGISGQCISNKCRLREKNKSSFNLEHQAPRKKQQAKPALKNKPKNQKHQQNRRYHQPQAHKDRLKVQKPIIQAVPVVKYIPKPKLQQAVQKQATRAIPMDIVKQQQTASKQTVQKQAPRALPKDFVKQQQAAKKSGEKPAQPM